MNTMTTTTQQPRGMKTVYTIIERGPNKSFWTKVGVGFVNNDGSINLRLDALPTNGTLQVRDYEQPREWERRGEARNEATEARRAAPLSADSLI